MKFVILGDPHIGRSLTLGKVGIGSSLNSRVVDQINLLDWTLEKAIENEAEHIITTGDVFEEVKPAPYLLTLFIEWLKRCEAHNIHTHILLGNHDILRTGNYYTSSLDVIAACELPNVSIYKNIETIFIDGVAFTLIPFRDRRAFGVETYGEAIQVLKNNLEYELATIPLNYTKVVIGHLSLEGSIPIGDEIDDISNELMCPLDIFNGYNYVWMGHVHKPQVLKEENPHIAHIGSMDISNFGETDHKKHIIIFDGKTHTQEMIPSRPLKKITISIPKDTKDTTQYVIDEIKKHDAAINKAIVRLDVHLSSSDLVPINRSDVEKALYDLNVHNISSISESKKMQSIVKNTEEAITNTIDVNSAIKMYADLFVEETIRGKFITLANDIYTQFKSENK